MRWLVGILLLANLSLFLWKSGDEIQVTRHTEPAATVPGVSGLTLLSEAPVAPTTPVAQPPAERAMPVESPDAESAEPAETVAQTTESSAPVAEPEPVTPPQEATTETTEPQPAAEEKAPVDVVAVSPPEPFCARLGPFAEEKSARAAIADLAAGQVFATLVTEGESRPTRYIVYIPPAASRQAALETLRELRSKKIDSFVFSSGELRNGVSLGIFGQRSSATRLLNDMKRKGYEATLLEREGEEQRFWISLGPKNAVRLTEDLQAALRERYAEARYSREECP